MPTTTINEFSHPIVLSKLTEEPMSLALTPSEQERLALARRFDLLSLDDLKADLAVRRLPEEDLLHQMYANALGDQLKAVVLVEGSLSSQVNMACVLTGTSIREKLDGVRFSCLYLIGDDLNEDELDDAGFEEMVVEVLNEDTFDAGELVAQELAMALPLFPRVEGAELPEGAQDNDGPKTTTPFANLKEMLDRRNMS